MGTVTHRLLGIALALALVPLSRSSAYDVLGGWDHPCPEGHFPAVCCLEPKGRGFVATLCGTYSGDAKPQGAAEHMHPRVAFDARTGWRWLEPSVSAQCPARTRSGSVKPQACPEGLSLPQLTIAELEKLRPGAAANVGPASGGEVGQEFGDCVEYGGYSWFGIGFYDSEGLTGVGGIGRFNPRTRKLEIRRPPLLRDSSSAALLHDGRWLWLATYRQGEGGDHPTHGLVRYAWTTDRLVQEVVAPCGFMVTGMVKLGDVLWVASDMGLSRRNANDRWEHFVFRVGEDPPIVPMSCTQMYDLARKDAVNDECDVDRDLRMYLRLLRKEPSGPPSK